MPTPALDSGATHPWNSAAEEISAQSRLKIQSSTPVMCGRRLRLLFLSWFCLCALTFPVHPQVVQQDQVPGPDSQETGQGPHGNLFGTWGGERTRLQERGVNFDL
jgi:hypothetical protein